MGVRRVLLSGPALQSPQPILEPVGVREGARDRPAGPEHPTYLRNEPTGLLVVFEQLCGDDDVEIRIVERERLLHVGPDSLDPELGRLLEGAAIDVHADDLVAVRIGARQRPGTAAEIENALARPADDPP